MTTPPLGAFLYIPIICRQNSGQDHSFPTRRMDISLHESLRMKVAILPSITEPTFGFNFEKFSNCRVLLIGDATNGTSEFYTARAKITSHLIHHHGFNIAAIQADWPDAEAIDCYVRHCLGPKPSTEAELDTTGAELDTAFQQFPT